MTQKKAQFFIGIDLGTTHCVLAYADKSLPPLPENIHIFPILQLVGPGQLAKKPLLPSFRYHALEGEIALEDSLLPEGFTPLKGEVPHVIMGEWARTLGNQSQGRLVSSAKSWLCQDQLAQQANLPVDRAKDVMPVSSVHASASYLHYLANAWDSEHPDHPLSEQDIVITIPASFNESARQLTLLAAEQAGLKSVHLVEEPQAVCYRWQTQYPQELAKSQLILVCDVGGGTTDLSLIAVKHKDQIPKLDRIGVGEHLMLGGDNIDLLLAADVLKKQNMASPSVKMLMQLMQQTRLAKENLLSTAQDETVNVTVLGTGSRLIGGKKTTVLNKNAVQQQVLDHLLPIVTLSDKPKKKTASIQKVGLPFEADIAISRHIIDFILTHQKSAQQATQSNQKMMMPDALLLNGGLFHSEIICHRLKTIIDQLNDKDTLILTNDAPDLAVAQGAVFYAFARAGKVEKITGGSARSFFLKLAQTDDSQAQGLCILPKGSKENETLPLKNQLFQLNTGQKVRFDLLSSQADDTFEVGETIELNEQNENRLRFSTLPPLITTFTDQKQSQVPVRLYSTYTDIGTLALTCRSDENEWSLNFHTRNHKTQLVTQSQQDAIALIESAFGDKDKNADSKAIKSLRSQLEKRLGKKEQWDLPLLRMLADTLLARSKKRKRSAQHERVWFNLLGYCLRPGFGDAEDKNRIEKLWPLFDQNLQYKNETQGYIDWWTCWRRVAGGLNAAQQQYIFQHLAHFFTDKALASKKTQQQMQKIASDDVIKLVSSLERLEANNKNLILKQLIQRLSKNSIYPSYWWAISRIANTQPFYGSAYHLSEDERQVMIAMAIKANWQQHPIMAFTMAMINAVPASGNSPINENTQKQLINKMQKHKQPEAFVTRLTIYEPLDQQAQKKLLGEGLPAGLSLSVNLSP